MTKLFASIIGFLLLFVNTTSADNMTSQIGLLWQINKAGVSPSYLFATIHSDDPQLIQWPAIVQSRLAQANSFGLEVYWDLPTFRTAANAKFLAGGQTLDQLLEPNLYNRVVEVLHHYNIPESLVKRMKPWAVFITLNMPLPKTGKYLDLLLYQQAMELQIPPYSLERIEEQLGLLETLSFAEQVTLMTDLITHFEELPQVCAQLQKLYLQRDLTALHTWSDKHLQEWSSQPALTQSFFKRVLTDRNFKMVERMLPQLQKGNTFIAVGALHLPGEKGLLKLLEARGYEVVAIY